MKKFTVIILAISMIFFSFTPEITASNFSYEDSMGYAGFSEIPSHQEEFLTPSAEWLQLTAGTQPAAFSQVTYQLADGVIEVDNTVTASLATAGQLMAGNKEKLLPGSIIEKGGYVSKKTLDAAAAKKGMSIKEGSIIVDSSSLTAFKVTGETEFSGVHTNNATLAKQLGSLAGTYGVERPQIHEILKDFTLGGAEGETVHLNSANITGFAPGIESSLVKPGDMIQLAFGDSLKGFKYISASPQFSFQFKDKKLNAKVGDGKGLTVKVSGGIGIDNIDLTARYTCNDGYKFAVSMAEESYLVIEMDDSNVNLPIKIPLFAIGVSIPKIGKIGGGIYAVVGLDGSLALEIEAREYAYAEIGAQGGTLLYVPTSVNGFCNRDFKTDGDFDLAGEINGYLKVGADIGLEIFGFDLAGAGAYLGAGVHAKTDGYMLDVELYGILDIFVKFAGSTIDLVNWRPTIVRKQVANSAGYKVEFLEVYVKPARVGGVLYKDGKAGFEPAKNIEYAVMVVPADVNFNPNNKEDWNNPKIRRYPASGFIKTNDSGEFIRKDVKLYSGDKVSLVFKAGGNQYLTNTVTPTMPFDRIIVYESDSWNNYVSGQVMPVRVINWEAPANAGPEDWWETAYYDESPLWVKPYKSYTWNVHVPTGYHSIVQTDSLGMFDTRNDFYTDEEFQVHGGNSGGYDFILDYDGVTVPVNCSVSSTVPLKFFRSVEKIPGSYKKFEEREKIIDQVKYNEYLWIINSGGSRTVTDSEFSFIMKGFSSVDFLPAIDRNWKYEGEMIPYGDFRLISDPGSQELIPILDAEGNPIGTSLFAREVTVEWVWQAHKNPVKITSANHAEVSAETGGSFLVTADGYKPFKYSLIGAPSGVDIMSGQALMNGRMTFPPGMKAGKYTFSIKAEEDRSRISYPNRKDWAKYLLGDHNDPYEGNDPSPPDIQVFTLTVKGTGSSEETLPEEPVTPPDVTEPEGPEVPGEETEPGEPGIPERTPPTIEKESHRYNFERKVGDPLSTIQIRAKGSTPIYWSLIKTGKFPLPEAVFIDESTGQLTIGSDVGTGTYYFTIKAENDVGYDTQESSLLVKESDQPVLPPIEPIRPIDPIKPIIPPSVPIKPLGFESNPTSFEPSLSLNLPSAMPGLRLDLPSPPNKITLRYDHDMDVYTVDRFTVDGSAFVKWHSLPRVHAFEADIETELINYIPLSYKYHYNHLFDDDTAGKIKAELERLMGEKYTAPLAPEAIKSGLNIADLNQYITNPWDQGRSFLNYGSMLEEMASQKGGSFLVELNGASGTFVTGKYFSGLKENGGNLDFAQDGVLISFSGKNIKSKNSEIGFDMEMYDFGYSTQTLNEDKMLNRIGGKGESFTFAFGHHGLLPGTATFAITTNISEGTSVNVYRFDGKDGQFTLIAENLTVEAGGVVTYKNNTMSEYIITTERIDDAMVSDMVKGQGAGAIGMWLYVIIILAVLLATAGAFVVTKRSMQGNLMS